MGRLGRWRPLAAAAIVVGLLALVSVAPAVAFSGFGPMTADATYGVEMTFDVEIEGGAPERLELLLDFAGTDTTFVAPVDPANDRATYRWDADRDHITPNTRVSYRWRATTGGVQTLSPAGELLYDDDRAGLDWQSVRLGEATVHWYGGAEAQARRFGELSADGAARAEATLGHELAGPIDIFVYDSQEEFFGALGPGAREWTGAAAFPELRTVFMWLGGGPEDYLETAIVHEVTHVVWFDATDNPFHDPARWLNEGFATWSEAGNADGERSMVEFEAGGAGLFAFPAITEQFPIGDRGARLAYAQGAVLVDMLIDAHGTEAMSRLTAAFREGATDDEALQAATGAAADDLYAAFFQAFGVAEPQPISPRPIPPSDVTVPGTSGAPSASDGPEAPPATPAGEDPGVPGVAVFTVIALLAAAGIGGAVWLSRRAQAREDDA